VIIRVVGSVREMIMQGTTGCESTLIKLLSAKSEVDGVTLTHSPRPNSYVTSSMVVPTQPTAT
jgi:hypothetical protein